MKKMKPAPLIIGIAALGGLGYYLTTQSADGGVLGGGSTTSNTTVQPGGVVIPGGDTTSTDDDSGSETVITKKWKKRGEVSKSYSRRTCDLNGFKGKIYTESDTYAPGETIKFAVRAKYYETSGDNDWWGYCGGGDVPASWYGNDELIFTGIKVTSDEDPSNTVVVQRYGTYPQSPEYTGGSSIVPSGDLYQSKLDGDRCRGDSGAKDKFGIAVYEMTAPSTPGRYTVKFEMGLDNPTGPCSAQSDSTEFSFLVKSGVVREAESATSSRFLPVSTYQSNHIW
jgi:hypothetical protein